MSDLQTQKQSSASGNAELVNIKTTSPAYSRQRIDGEFSLKELPWIGKINLRGNIADKNFKEKVEKAISCELPAASGIQITQGAITVYWMGPDEWLIHCKIDDVQSLMGAIREQVAPIHHAVTDVSDYYTVLQIEGPNIAGLLSRGCPMDLHPSVFKSSECAQTRFGHASILLHKFDQSTFNIQIRWSYTEYLWDYLVSAINAVDR